MQLINKTEESTSQTFTEMDRKALNPLLDILGTSLKLLEILTTGQLIFLINGGHAKAEEGVEGLGKGPNRMERGISLAVSEKEKGDAQNCGRKQSVVVNLPDESKSESNSLVTSPTASNAAALTKKLLGGPFATAISREHSVSITSNQVSLLSLCFFHFFSHFLFKN